MSYEVRFQKIIQKIPQKR